jgi:hypothetical protein
MSMGRPQPVPTASFAANTLTEKGMQQWMLNLTTKELEQLQNRLQESSRTGNVKHIAGMLLPFTAENKALAEMETRLKQAHAWLTACMMKGLPDSELSYNKIVKMVGKAMKKKLIAGAAAAGAGDDSDSDSDDDM